MRFIGITILFACAFALAMWVAIMIAIPGVPSCAEDDHIVGTGQFHSTGYWDSYICEGDAS